MELSFLFSLEREASIFLALTGGHTARILLREALGTYCDPDAFPKQHGQESQHQTRILDQLQMIVRCLSLAGHSEDIQLLRALSKDCGNLMGLEPHPAQQLKVKQVLKTVEHACRAITSRG